MSQLGVVVVGEEPCSYRLDGVLDPFSELAKRAGTRGDGFDVPLLEMATSWGVAFESGAVAGAPQCLEVAVGVAVEYGLQVKFAIRLAGEGGVVSQQAEHLLVGDDAPQVLVGAVQELLQEAVR